MPPAIRELALEQAVFPTHDMPCAETGPLLHDASVLGQSAGNFYEATSVWHAQQADVPSFACADYVLSFCEVTGNDAQLLTALQRAQPLVA